MLTAFGRALVAAEETIALVARATPKNALAEIARLGAAFSSRRRLRPRFVHAPGPDFTALREKLARIHRALGAHGRLGALYAERVEELDLEAQLAEQVGTERFGALAGQRYAPSARSSAVDAFVTEALAAAEPNARGRLTASDDRTTSASLCERVRRLAAELALPLRVEIRPGQMATAATGRSVVGIRPGVMLTDGAAARIAHHELLGHALPRARAERAELALLSAGSAGASDHEEGRALLVERRAGLMDAARRRELALRHIAALAVRAGADFHETTQKLAARGADSEQALEIAARVHRGGGLAREIVYLPAYFEVSEAFTREPALERWFERGRVSLRAARELQALAPGRYRGIASSARW